MRTLEHSGYRNIFSFELGNYNLFGTETLCGDWDGDLLIVAQDFAPASFIPARIDAKDPFPYVTPTDARTTVEVGLSGFGTGFVPQRDMIRAGAVLNAVCITVLSLWGWFVLR